jgi:hypothetical protein
LSVSRLGMFDVIVVYCEGVLTACAAIIHQSRHIAFGIRTRA